MRTHTRFFLSKRGILGGTIVNNLAEEFPLKNNLGFCAHALSLWCLSVQLHVSSMNGWMARKVMTYYSLVGTCESILNFF